MRQQTRKVSAARKGAERAFAFLPYYTPMGRRYLEDILETMGEYVDALKIAGGSFSLLPRLPGHEISH